MSEFWTETILPAVLTAVGAAIVAALGLLVKWLNEKAASSRLFRVAATFGELANSVVAELEISLRPKLQSALADGTLTPAEGAALKAEAMKRLQALAPTKLKDAAEGIFGPAVGDWLGGLVERANLAQNVSQSQVVTTQPVGRPPPTPR